ncbi:MAG: glycosyltransferase [Sphingomonadaceae bacterium]|nr:glycosyltransferase [Sphingomonadaceae bacterium]
MEGHSSASYALFSRDERTQGLFRASWLAAIDSIGCPSFPVCRGFGLLAFFRYILRFHHHRKSRRLIFGTSEILLCLWLSKPRDVLVFTGLGRLLQTDGLSAQFVRLALRLAYKKQTVIALNEDDQQYLSNLFSNAVILINGEGYKFSDDGFPTRPRPLLRVGYVGRLLKSKAVDQLIEAAAALDDCHLTLVGDIDFSNSDAIDRKWLAEKIESATGKLQYLGFVTDVKSVLRDVDVVVSMSVREGLPFSTLDAIDSGCLAVLSPVPGHLSFDGLEGVVFSNPGNLIEVMRSIVATPGTYFNFDPLRRRSLCREKFGFESVVRSIATMLGQTDATTAKQFNGYRR